MLSVMFFVCLETIKKRVCHLCYKIVKKTVFEKVL